MEKTQLPWEIIIDILSRLPVKDLLRYRCVSKPWCSLIDGPDFINLHLKHSLQTNSNLALVIRGCGLHWANLDPLDSAIQLNHPLDYEGGTEVLGSCNGLLALFNSDEDVALWNPATRRYRNLPKTEIEFPRGFGICEYIIYGFGYDSINDDYKLVRMIQFYGVDDDSFDSEVKVYSLKAKTWKRISDFPYYLRYKRTYGVLVSNALHWVVSRKPQSDVSNLIGVFDLVTEEYREVPQPEYMDKRSFHMNVAALGGCLCVVCNYNTCDRYDQVKADRVDIWVMKEYGVKESWTKLYSIKESDVNGSFSYVMPVVYVKSHDRVLTQQESKKFFVYGLESKKVEHLMIPGTPDFFEVFQCLESLVGLDGRDGELSGKKAEKMRKRRLKQEMKRKQMEMKQPRGLKRLIMGRPYNQF